MLNIAIINSPYYMLHVMQLYIYLRSTQLVGQKEELGELGKQVKARNMLQTGQSYGKEDMGHISYNLGDGKLDLGHEISEEISGIYHRVYGK